MIAYFCTESGARLKAPGVSKLIDPENGIEMYEEPAPESEEPKKEPKPKGGK
jgi:hypothetical protein